MLEWVFSKVENHEEFIKIEKGDNFGWPYCYYDQIKGKKVLGPEYGGDGNIICLLYTSDAADE